MDKKQQAKRQAARVLLISKMFASYGPADENQIKIYLEDLRHIPDRIFKASLEKAVQDHPGDWAPKVGQIFAAYRSLDASSATTGATEPQMNLLTLPEGERSLDTRERTVEPPDRSQEVPADAVNSFHAKTKSRSNFYLDQHRSWMSCDHAWALALQDIAGELNQNGVPTGAAEHARRVWEKRQLSIKQNEGVTTKQEYLEQTSEVQEVMKVAQRIREEGLLLDPAGPKRHLLSTIAAYHELGIPFPLDPITRSGLDVQMRTFARNGGDASWYKEARRAVA